MIKLTLSNDKYFNDLMELVYPFGDRTYEDFSINVEYFNPFTLQDIQRKDSNNKSDKSSNEFLVKITSDKFVNFVKYSRYKFDAENEIDIKRKEKRYLKISLYNVLVFLTGIELPYGCLTGIRPTKMYVEVLQNPEKYTKNASDLFFTDYSVSYDKLNLIKMVVEVQAPLRNDSNKKFDFFVFVPFCPSKCAYCSFVSIPIKNQNKLVEPYVDCLIKEIENTKIMMGNRIKDIRSIYVGGGTPTALSEKQLKRILDALDFAKGKEFTVEAGRPDTITKSMLAMMKSAGVSRISINPQTFNDNTLSLIGRNHNSKQIIKAYNMAKNMFDINMDLIACLPNETFEDFKFSLDAVIRLSAENITVHTLYLKKASELKLDGYTNTDYLTSSNMVNYALTSLSEAGYNPYYMYRQKYTSGNLENVGYSKAGKECIYNIDIMEEDTSIIACGANGISKIVSFENQPISRFANYKNPVEYVKNFDKLIEKKGQFWSEFFK